MANIININSGANTFVERSPIFNAYMADIREIPLLSREDELKLLYDYHNAETPEDEKLRIRDKLLKHNQRFVVGAVKQYANNDVNLLMELLSEANIAFMEAIEKYDINREKKPRLLSWAAFFIRRDINLYLCKTKSLVRQAYDNLLYAQLVKARNILTQREGREVTDDEIFTYLSEEKNFAISDVNDVRQITMNSIDTSIQEDDDFNVTMSDYNVVTSESNHCEKTFDLLDKKTILTVAMNTLNEKEKRIFNMLYGLDGRVVNETMDTVAAELGCSSERVRQIHTRGLNKMKVKLTKYLKCSYS